MAWDHEFGNEEGVGEEGASEEGAGFEVVARVGESEGEEGMAEGWGKEESAEGGAVFKVRGGREGVGWLGRGGFLLVGPNFWGDERGWVVEWGDVGGCRGELFGKGWSGDAGSEGWFRWKEGRLEVVAVLNGCGWDMCLYGVV